MALEFLYRKPAQTPANPGRIAIFPGAWNPPTVAHVAIARAALEHADDVVWVLPRAFPHKGFEGAGFTARCGMLETLTGDTGFSAAISEGGLYAGIAEEARAFFGAQAEILLVCGRDAAERMATWDYGVPNVFDDLLQRYRLLVAARRGEYEPAGHHSGRILRLNMEEDWDEVSSSEVRRRMAAGEQWRPLVPQAITAMVESLYPMSDKERTE